MTTESTLQLIEERRIHSRARVKTQVYVVIEANKRVLTQAENLSAAGVFLRTNTLKLTVGQEVELIFVINLDTVSKLHRRKGIVAHTSKDGTGFKMLAITKPQINEDQPPP